MRASPRSIESSFVRGISVTVLALALATSLAACKRGGADGKDAEGKEKAEQTEAVPVETARVANRTMVGRDGHRVPALPAEAVLGMLRAAGRI